MPQDDLSAYGDLVGAEPERHGLDGERLVDPGGEVEGADDDVVGAAVTVVLTGEARHVGRLQGVRSVLRGAGRMWLSPARPDRSDDRRRLRTGRS